MSGGMTISAAEATWGMIILFIVLTIVVFFFCCVPTYKALQQRYSHWEDPENDPRWNVDQFQFSPTSPRMQTKAGNGGYNRLSVCSQQTVSRGSSFRNNCVMPRMEDQFEVKLPPAYADICSGSGEISSLGTPPAYTSEPEEMTDKSDSDNNKPAATATQQTNSKIAQKAAILKAASKQAPKPAAEPATQPPAATPRAGAAVNKSKAAALKGVKKPTTNPPADNASKAATAPEKKPAAAVVTAECEKPAQTAAQSSAAAPARKTYKKIKKNKPTESST